MDDRSTLLRESAVAMSDAAVSRYEAFAALDLVLRRYPGHKLFTVLEIDWDRGENQRVYTSDPLGYPCGGVKRLLPDSEFFKRVVVEGTARLCPDREACRRAFPDYALIESLGCESAINVPIRSQDSTIGSLNLLHQSGWYEPGMSSFLEPLAAMAATVLLRHKTSGH